MKNLYLILFFVLIFFPKCIFAKINNVKFISQVLPGNWEQTLNCGQTSYYMVLSYLNGIDSEDKLDYNEIKKIDDWLYKEYGDPINDYNGYYTTTEKIRNLAEKKDNLKNVYISYGAQDFDKLKIEIDNGNIPIVLVRSNMSINKDGHFMVFIGYDDENVYFNDPGKMLGRKRKYLIKTFLKVWKTQNYEYIVIKNNENIVIDKPKNNSIEIIDNKTDSSSGILLNKTIKNGDNTLTTVIREGNDRLQIITVDADIEKEDINENSSYGYGDSEEDIEIENNDFLNEPEEQAESFGVATQKLEPFLDDNNWLHLAENLIIDYNVPQNIGGNDAEDLENDDFIEENGNENFGYGYGDLEDEEVVSYGYGEENLNEDKIYDLNFEFKNNYKGNKLIIPLSWKSIKNKDLKFDLDYKIDDGEWKKVFSDLSLLKYDFYVKYNKHNYTFRLRSSYENNYSNYLELSQYIELVPKENFSYLYNIENDTVLAEGNTYFCYYCSLSANNVLLIEKDVKIKMSKDAIFDIYGDVIAMGDANNIISILPNGGDDIPGNWGSINFMNNNFIELNYISVGYGGYYSPDNSVREMIRVFNAQNVIINNSVFYSNMYPEANINIMDSNIKIANSKFYNSTNGANISNSVGEIFNNEFVGNTNNIMLENVHKDLKIYNNKISGASNYAIVGNDIFADIRDNIFENNGQNLIFMNHLNLYNGSEVLNKNIYSICEMHVYSGASLKIVEGAIFKEYTNCGMFYIDGEIIIDGTNEPIVFTSYYDDRYGGDTNSDGGSISPKFGDWGYLKFTSTSSGFINNAIFEYGGYHYSSSDNRGMVFISGAKDIDIKNSSFLNVFYRGIEIEDSFNINIINNIIKDANGYGIQISGGENISIKDNHIYNSGIYGILSIFNDYIINEGNIFENNIQDIMYLN